jgi:hypothetical protein
VRTAGLKEKPVQNDYGLVAEVTREDEARLQVFKRGVAANAALTNYHLADYIDEFDRNATPQQFARQSEPVYHVGSQFGPDIVFSGYDLPTNQLQAGDTLYLDLYWQALNQPNKDYRAFVHLTDGTTLWAQQDDTPACRLPTTIWRSGQRSTGQFRLTLPPDMLPGRYSLVIGLYQADTLERLKITGGSGNFGDDFLWLGDIEVTGS